MPEISRFYGLIIRMYSRGEHPPPHFHVQYGDRRASVEIESLKLLEGELPTRARRLLREWGRAHQQELRDNWQRAREHRPVVPVDPLP